MILLSRTVPRSLLAGLLGIFFFVCACPCAAVGCSSIPLDASTAEADLVVLSLPKTFRLRAVEQPQCSNVQLAQHWFRFRSPQAYQLADAVKRFAFGKTRSFIRQIRQHQEWQRDWIRENWTLAVDESRTKIEQWAAICFGGLTFTDVSVEDFAGALELPNFVMESNESAYWDYYRDCERWGVELTRSVQISTTGKVAKRAGPTGAGFERGTEAPSNALESSNFQAMFVAIGRASEWVGRTLRSIEFAAIESRVASHEGIFTRSK